MIETARVRLRPWRESDRAPLAAMHSDEEVMADYGGPLTRTDSDAKLDRYAKAFETCGFSRLVLERLDGAFLGYVGVMPIWPTHPVAPGLRSGGGLFGPRGDMAMPQRAPGPHCVMASPGTVGARCSAIQRRTTHARRP